MRSLTPFCIVANIAVCLSLVLPAPGAVVAPSTADRLIADGHFRRAQPLVQAALEKHPQDIEALINLSTIQYAFGQLDASIATAEKAVLADEGNAVTHAQLLNALGAKLASPRLGMMDKLSTARRFHKETDRTLQLDPKNLYALEAVSRFYWYAPSVGGGDKARALDSVGRLIQLDPVRGYALKAELDATDLGKGPDKGVDKSKTAAVQSDWKQAVAAQPNSYIAHIGLGTAMLNSIDGQLPTADAAPDREAKKALAINPGRTAAYRLLAASYVLALKFEDLNAALAQARNAVPDDFCPMYQAADTILMHGMQAQLPLAEQYLRGYLAQPAEGLEPTAAMAHWRLGLVLEKEDRRVDAIRELEAAVSLDSSLDSAKKDLKRLK